MTSKASFFFPGMLAATLPDIRVIFASADERAARCAIAAQRLIDRMLGSGIDEATARRNARSAADRAFSSWSSMHGT
jgi:hypothetical protein